MEIIDHIFDMSEKILKLSNDVYIDECRLEHVAIMMKANPLVTKQVDKNEIKDIKVDRCAILKELVADSVNYCYWQYSPEFRPNGAGSTKMRELLDEYFDPRSAFTSHKSFTYNLRRFYKAMMMDRFPLMDKRLNHLMALTTPLSFPESGRVSQAKISVAESLVSLTVSKIEFERVFNFLIRDVDGFGEDPFLKRAILFFLQLNRIYGLYEEDIKQLPIPADYQVPKMLSSKYGILVYSPELRNKIVHGIHLQENGPEEMAIRAGAILAAAELGNQTGMTPADVDGWFFMKRHESDAPFHCCITSNY
jgi:hypothetical protein